MERGQGLDWWLLDAGMHEGVRRLVGISTATTAPALHGATTSGRFWYLIGNDHANSVFAWMRAEGATR